MGIFPNDEQEAYNNIEKTNKMLVKIGKKLTKRERKLVKQGYVPKESDNLSERIGESMNLAALMDGIEINKESRAYKLMQDEVYSDLMKQKRRCHGVRDFAGNHLDGLKILRGQTGVKIYSPPRVRFG